MITELIKYILSPAEPVVKKTGYLHEAIAIESRYARARNAWQAHIDETRKHIITYTEKQNNRDSVVLAGAGSLHDIPVKLLADKFKKVYLLDIVFTNKARRLARNYENIELIQHDLSGIQSPQKLLQPDRILPKTEVPSLPSGLMNPDSFISVNLLSQLAVTPRVNLERSALHSEQALDDWCKRLIENQLLFMRKLGRPVCIISDYCHHVYDKKGILVQSNDMLYGVSPGKKQAQWQWSLAPKGELREGYQIEADVACWYC